MKKILTLLIILIMVISGCTSSNEANGGQVTPTDHEEITRLQEENNWLKESINRLEVSYDTLVFLKEEQVSIIEDIRENSQLTTSIFPIYDGDVDTLEEVISYYVNVEYTEDLEGKIEKISQYLSKFNFSGLPIEFIGIELIDSKKIVTLDLRDLDEGLAWKSHYFQGSTGGSRTSTKLISSILQRNYEGEWIDGVRFLYNGGESNPYGDHVYGLIGEIHYR